MAFSCISMRLIVTNSRPENSHPSFAKHLSHFDMLSNPECLRRVYLWSTSRHQSIWQLLFSGDDRAWFVPQTPNDLLIFSSVNTLELLLHRFAWIFCLACNEMDF